MSMFAKEGEGDEEMDQADASGQANDQHRGPPQNRSEDEPDTNREVS